VFVALPLALLMARLIAESARLTVGYSVCCFVVIMGWLTHEQQLDSWIPLRLFWTAFGIIMALLSLRLFWPARARTQQRQGLLQLLVDLGHTLKDYLQAAPEAQRRAAITHQLRGLRINLLSLRDQRVNAMRELGPLAADHPIAQMWELLDHACEALILDLDELRRLPDPQWQAWGLQRQHEAALRYSHTVADRLLAWQATLSRSLELQPPPAEPRPALPLEILSDAESQNVFQQLSPTELQQVAGRLIVLNRIDHTMESTERHWRTLLR
jgi:hypothetical protein